MRRNSYLHLAGLYKIGLTKLTHSFRNVYYQNPDLFRSQSAVDDMVDNLAFTVGVGREELNIVRT